MPDSTPAVFLSYASQDADAARRIAEALRAAGVEVWFDEAELAGGDAWDAKIRKQIQACTLFVPLISANTQARAEGYFRLEWHLAEQRTYLMAHDQPFLFPIVIDDTTDADARVPDRFRERQWMRLATTTPEAIARRLKHVLTGETAKVAGVADPGAEHRSPGSPTPATARTSSKRRPALTFGAATAIIVGIAVAFMSLPTSDSATDTAPTTATAQTSDVESLLAETWSLLVKQDAHRLELEAAARLATRATELAPNHPDAWATLSKVHIKYISNGFDNSPARRMAARETAERAMQMDGTSYEARLALMEYWAYAIDGLWADNARQDEIKATAHQLLQEQPDDARAHYTLAYVLSQREETFEEAVQQFKQAAKDPNFAPAAWMGIAWGRKTRGEQHEFEIAVQNSRAAAETPNNLVGAILNELEWRGDLDAAEALVRQVSQRDLQNEDVGSMAAWVQVWRHEPQDSLRYLQNLSREWISAGFYEGPVAYMSGTAREMAGQGALAQRDFTRALELVEEYLESEPDEAWLHAIKAELLHKLGRPDDAQRAYDLVREMNQTQIFMDVVLEPVDVVLDRLEAQFDSATRFVTAASLRHAYYYEPIRDHPRFQALLARADASPRHTPNPVSRDADHTSRIAAPAKSIAVLPFANRSASADDAYFTDGIHDDLLTSLSRIRDLKTISRTSVMGYRDTTENLRVIGEELGVATILQGGVQRAGNQVRINVQLTDAATDENLWAETFTRELTAGNIFAIQTEIATAVTTALQSVLSPEEQNQLERLPTQNYAALELYFEAGAHGTSVEGWESKIALYQQAIDLDPEFTLAYTAQANALLSQIYFGGLASRVQIAKARPLIDRALELDPNSGDAHAAQGQMYYIQGDNERAEAAYRRALELSPNDAGIHAGYAYLKAWNLRQFDEAIALIRRAGELDPENVDWRRNEAEFLQFSGQLADARALFNGLIEENPDDALTWSALGRFHLERNELARALTTLRQAHALDSDSPVTCRALARLYQHIGDPDTQTFWLERSFRRTPEEERDLAHRIQVYRHRGEWAEAEALLPEFWANDRNAAVFRIRDMTAADLAAGRTTHLESRMELAYAKWLQDELPTPTTGEDFFELIIVGWIFWELDQPEQARRRFDFVESASRHEQVPPILPLAIEALIATVTLPPDEAMEVLADNVDAGLPAQFVFTIPLFSPLHDHPRFQEMFAGELATLQQELNRIRELEATGELAPIPDLLEDTL